jgi:DNA-directed RNA polymerase specialized sigma24 family protein
MKKREPPSPEAFDKLLRWLDPDRDKAANRYLIIQLRLIRIYAAKGCCDPEDLADETFNVAALKVDWLLENYIGDPALYLYAIARNIFREQKPKPPPPPPTPPDTDESERRSTCLDRCLVQLTTPEERCLLRKYHEGEGQERIRARKELADKSGLTINALRIKVHHIQARLRPCMNDCLRLLGG